MEEEARGGGGGHLHNGRYPSLYFEAVYPFVLLELPDLFMVTDHRPLKSDIFNRKIIYKNDPIFFCRVFRTMNIVNFTKWSENKHNL